MPMLIGRRVTMSPVWLKSPPPLTIWSSEGLVFPFLELDAGMTEYVGRLLTPLPALGRATTLSKSLEEPLTPCGFYVSHYL